jgi:hypothetical protein
VAELEPPLAADVQMTGPEISPNLTHYRDAVVLTLVVPDPPPTRSHPGRSADRNSPNALPLVRAGEAVLRADPDSFPRVFTSIFVAFGKTLPDADPIGYQPEHAIYEVLQDIRLVIEPEGWSSNHSHDPSADFYVVTFTLRDE